MPKEKIVKKTIVLPKAKTQKSSQSLVNRLAAMELSMSKKLEKLTKSSLSAEHNRVVSRPVLTAPPRAMAVYHPTEDLDSLQSSVQQMARSGTKNLNPTSLLDFKANAYLKALVDPEHCGLNVGIPDSHVDPTYRYQSITERNLDSTYFSSDGYLPIVTCPDANANLILPAPSFSFRTSNEYFYSLIESSGGNGSVLRDSANADMATGHLPVTESKRVTVSRIVTASQSDFNSVYYADFSKLVNAVCSYTQLPVIIGNWAAGANVNQTYGKYAIGNNVNPARLSPPSDIAQSANLSMWEPGSAGNGDRYLFPYAVTYQGEPTIVLPGQIGGDPVTADLGVVVNFGCRGHFTIGQVEEVGLAAANVYLGVISLIGIDSTGAQVNCPIFIPLNVDFIKTAGDAAFGSFQYPEGGQICFTAGYKTQSETTENFYNSATGALVTNIVHLKTWTFTIIMCIVSDISVTLKTYGKPRAPGVPPLTINVQSGDVSTLSIVLDSVSLGYCPRGVITPSQTANGKIENFGIGCTMCAYTVPELSIFDDGMTAGIRTVSQSAWISYAGSTLDDSGMIYGSYIADRRFVADRDHTYLTPYALDLTGVAYRGKLPDGVYQIWKPQSEADLSFRPFDASWNFNKPYNVCVAWQPTPGNTGDSIAIRICTNWEVITYAPLFRNNLQTSIVDPKQIIHVFQALQHFPMTMANEEHTATIASFFSDLWGGVKSVASGLWNSVAPAIGDKLSGWISAL